MNKNGKNFISETDLLEIMLRVRAALDHEKQSANCNERLCSQMQRHLDVILKIIPPDLVKTADDMYYKPAFSI